MRPFIYEAAEDADAALRMAAAHGASTQYLPVAPTCWT
jgi:hypothetical protein